MRSAHLALVAGGGLALALTVVFAMDRQTPSIQAPESLSERFPMGPPPTEHHLGTGSEKQNKKHRKAWFRELRKAPEGVDVQAIDRDNGLAQTLRRNAMVAASWKLPWAWRERGSENLAGRMHVATHSRDGVHVYAGSSLGGVWRGALDGTGWEPLADDLYGGAHWLAVIPAEDGAPDVILAATDSGLVHYTEDDGATWVAPAGLGPMHRVRRLLHDLDGTLYLVGLYWETSTLYRSTDGGRSFEEILDLGAYQGDVWAPRTGEGGLVWLVLDNEVRISADQGQSWEPLGSFGGDYARAELVGSEAGSPRLWAMAQVDSGLWHLYRSDDAGASWALVHDEVTDYWGSLAASTVDADRFAWGGVEAFVTRDGGAGFSKANAWGEYYQDMENKLHADVPGIDVVPVDGGEIWYVSTDGGLYRSLDGLDTVENLSLSGLRVSQYYDVLTSRADPSHVAAGAQDQGYQLTLDLAPAGERYTFEQVISGDYGHLTSSDGSHELVYSVYPGFMLVQIGEEEPRLGYADFPSTPHAWLPPVVADPDDPEGVFFVGQQLYRYRRDQEYVWLPEAWSDQRFGSGQWEYASALAFAPTDSSRAYAATNGGRLFYSTDKGRTWTESEDLGPDAHYFYGTALVVSSIEPDVAWVGGNGYSTDAVFQTTDGGRTWEPWGDGLPRTLVYSLAEAPDGSGRLFAGTQTAAYGRGPEDGQWLDMTAPGVPVTIFWSVEALQHENTMRFGTYGRGIWDLQLDPEGEGCFPVVDRDGDGVGCDLDCDDHDPTISPDAVDDCDGWDVNCDPTDPVEEDADGDGFMACEECDDSDPSVHPGAEDLPGDGIDQDCDGSDASGCGCASGGVGSGLWLLVLLSLLSRRREPRSRW